MSALEPDRMTAHIVPRNDLKPHEYINCWCRPEYDEEQDILIHNSMDGREAFETGERKPS